MLTHRFPSRGDLAKSFSYNPASQIVSEAQSPASEAFAPPAIAAQNYTTNALNQYVSIAADILGYNPDGALTAQGARSYAYDNEARLTGSNQGGNASLAYDPAGRLQGVTANGLNTRFLYDGGQLTGEIDAAGTLIRRYIPLPGADETLAMQDFSGISFPLADQRNTPMAKFPEKWALANGSVAVQFYGAFGEEGPSNIGRFGFTGSIHIGADRTTPHKRRYDPRMRIPELGLYYYKARFYDPALGRFLTPDPAGMVDGPNLYAYVLNDPVNFIDPEGLEAEEEEEEEEEGRIEEVVVEGRRRQQFLAFLFFGLFRDGTGSSGGPGLLLDGLVADHFGDFPEPQYIICTGRVTFSAVGPLPQAPGDSAFAPGTKPANGTVAIAGAETFRFGRRALREGAAAAIRIYPEGLDDLLSANGGPAPPFSVSDFGDINIRNAPGTRFDIYRFDTLQGARNFGVRRDVPVTIIVPPGGQCPQGTSAQ